MKLFRLLLLAFAVIGISIAGAQEAPQASGATVTSKSPDPAATLAYIHDAWTTLTRSMTDCHSLVDIKVTAHPILYMPVEVPAPPEVSALSEKCNVKVVTLPRRIDKLGDVRPEELPAEGLLYLPNPYVVPGGRFNEMYGWDSYFILLGLEADHREALAKGMVDNFLFEIEHYGAVLNANRTYYLTRSQPPFLTAMIRAVYENPASFPQLRLAVPKRVRGSHKRIPWQRKTIRRGREPSTRQERPGWRATSTTARGRCRRWQTTARITPM